MKLGKNGKNRLKIREKAEILVRENFQKQGNQLKKGTLTPLGMVETLVGMEMYDVTPSGVARAFPDWRTRRTKMRTKVRKN